MPAYGKNLSPPEVTALVSFLETLHPDGENPARDASQEFLRTGELDPPQGVPATK
jgi:ubiquinol-cytochrome c reductase cytochrome b subunit